MTKIYIGAGPALYGAFTHLFLVKAPNGDLTTQTLSHKLIEAVPSQEILTDPPFGNLVVFNDIPYNASANRLDYYGDFDGEGYPIDDGDRVWQFNGLATDRDTGIPIAAGGPDDQLRAWFHSHGFLEVVSQT